MTDREKLVELLEANTYESLGGYLVVKGFETAKELADHLLANGVTVQCSEGCDFCKTFNFAKAKTEVDKYGARIILIGGACYSTGEDAEDTFKFCPKCGRKLPEPPKEE